MYDKPKVLLYFPGIDVSSIVRSKYQCMFIDDRGGSFKFESVFTGDIKPYNKIIQDVKAHIESCDYILIPLYPALIDLLYEHNISFTSLIPLSNEKNYYINRYNELSYSINKIKTIVNDWESILKYVEKMTHRSCIIKKSDSVLSKIELLYHR